MHVVWDWNGTLFDDLHVVVAGVNAVLAEAGLPPIDADGYRRHYTRPVHTFYERLFDRPIAPDEWTRLDDTYHAAYRAGLEAADLTRGARDVLANLDGDGRPQSLLSMWRHPELIDLVGRFDIAHHFRRVDGVRDVGGGRKRRYLERHLAALRVPADGVLVVGDTPDDAHAAAGVGARCVLFDGGSHHLDDLQGTGAPVVTDLEDVLDYV